MRMILDVTFPLEPFNTLVRNGTLGDIMGRIMDEIKPEAVYFSELDGHRGAIIIIDVPNASAIPRIAEPFFLALNAECKLRIAMTPEDLMNSGIDTIGNKWG